MDIKPSSVRINRKHTPGWRRQWMLQNENDAGGLLNVGGSNGFKAPFDGNTSFYCSLVGCSFLIFVFLSKVCRKHELVAKTHRKMRKNKTFNGRSSSPSIILRSIIIIWRSLHIFQHYFVNDICHIVGRIRLISFTKYGCVKNVPR